MLRWNNPEDAAYMLSFDNYVDADGLPWCYFEENYSGEGVLVCNRKDRKGYCGCVLFETLYDIYSRWSGLVRYLTPEEADIALPDIPF